MEITLKIMMGRLEIIRLNTEKKRREKEKEDILKTNRGKLWTEKNQPAVSMKNKILEMELKKK